MDDGFIFWGRHPDFQSFSVCLNNLHPAIKYLFEKTKSIQTDHSQPYQVLNIMDIEVTLHSDKTVETDIYCKDTTRTITLNITVHILNIVKAIS